MCKETSIAEGKRGFAARVRKISVWPYDKLPESLKRMVETLDPPEDLGSTIQPENLGFT